MFFNLLVPEKKNSNNILKSVEEIVDSMRLFCRRRFDSIRTVRTNLKYVELVVDSILFSVFENGEF